MVALHGSLAMYSYIGPSHGQPLCCLGLYLSERINLPARDIIASVYVPDAAEIGWGRADCMKKLQLVPGLLCCKLETSPHKA